MSQTSDGFMDKWKDGAHPNHPRGERSELCDQCILSHPTVVEKIATLKAKLVRALADTSLDYRRLGKYVEAVKLAEERTQQAESSIAEALIMIQRQAAILKSQRVRTAVAEARLAEMVERGLTRFTVSATIASAGAAENGNTRGVAGSSMRRPSQRPNKEEA